MMYIKYILRFNYRLLRDDVHFLIALLNQSVAVDRSTPKKIY